MARRVPYAPPYDGPELPPERAAVSLYRMLAHSPRLEVHWYQWVEGLRWDVEAPRHYREMALLRSVQLAGSEYAWAYHAAGAGEHGISEEQLRDLRRWRESDRFDERERAVLRLCDEVAEVAASEDCLAELGRLFDPAEVVELVVTAGFYQGAARIFQALGAEVDPDFARHIESMR